MYTWEARGFSSGQQNAQDRRWGSERGRITQLNPMYDTGGTGERGSSSSTERGPGQTPDLDYANSLSSRPIMLMCFLFPHAASQDI